MTAPQRRPRLVFVINSLTGGGAERALANLLAFARDALAPYETHLVLLDRETSHHRVGPHVKVTTLDARHGLLRSVVQLHRVLTRLRPVATVSFLTRANCANIIASRLAGAPCIVSERVHTTEHFGRRWSGLPGKALVRLLYPRADAVVAVSSGVAEDLATRFAVPAEKISVIGNGVSVAAILDGARAAPPFDLPPTFLVAAGRLVPNKNFELLIRAYARAQVGPPLIILGQGPQRERLEALVEELGLRGRVTLPGYVDNPYAVISRALAFVSASNAEGFPNALVEAMAVGCPVVATDCEAGPAEILAAPHRATTDVVETPYGLLSPVNDEAMMADALQRMMNPTLRAQFAAAGRRRAADFAPESVVARYMELIAAQTQRPARREIVLPQAEASVPADLRH